MSPTPIAETIPELSVGSRVFEAYLANYKWFLADYDEYCEQLVNRTEASGWFGVTPGPAPSVRFAAIQ